MPHENLLAKDKELWLCIELIIMLTLETLIGKASVLGVVGGESEQRVRSPTVALHKALHSHITGEKLLQRTIDH